MMENNLLQQVHRRGTPQPVSSGPEVRFQTDHKKLPATKERCSLVKERSLFTDVGGLLSDISL